MVDTADLPFEPTMLGGETSSSSMENFRSWWPANEQKSNYYSIDQAFECVKKSVQENGPYDGVLGFSQGAGFAGILCAAIEHLDELTKNEDQKEQEQEQEEKEEEYKQKGKPLKFGVFYSGFRTKPEYLQHFYDPPISTPSLHILGSLDTVVSEERSMALFNACNPDTRTLITHPGGHFVPNSKPMVAAVVNFIQQLEQKHSPAENSTSIPVTNTNQQKKQEPSSSSSSINTTTTTKANDDDWDMFDKIGKA